MNLQELKNILSTSFDLDVWKNILLNILGDKIEYFIAPQNIIGENIVGGGHIGSVRLDDGKTLGIIDIEVDDHITIKRNRKALRGMVKDYIDQQKIHALLVFFHNRNQDDYRVSYVVKQTYFTPEGEFIKHESEPKRYTFLLGKNESCTTAALRLLDLIKKRREGSLYMLDLTEAFSVEKLNKEFFDKYVKHYRNFCEDIINNDNCRAKEFGIVEKQDFKHDDNKPIRDYVKKMMGRLVFLHFLQKRGWMNGDYAYLHNLYKAKTEFHNDYLEQILEPLFFWVLNTKEDKRIPEKIANLGDVSGIPYLNGGLFEKDRLDDKEVVFRKSLFDELFEFFSQYNFTIDENDPYDAEVGIDPEMLGHIFENLLEDNKDKGAFYTPKEIVQYMCKQSLVEYLKSKTKQKPKEWEACIVKLVDKHILDENVQNDRDFITDIYTLLSKVKICDPAIGSGAFPMGMLSELFHCRQKLYGSMNSSIGFDPATIKREIIQNNIYGVDIEQGAVDIARLRFWLSLIVDAEKASPLPNFDYKIVCGNSLVTTFNSNPIDLKTRTKGTNANKIKDKKKQLFDLQSKFYNLSGSEKLEREVEIKQCLIEIIELQLDFKLEVLKDSNIQMLSLFEEFNTKARKTNTPSYINAQIAELQRIKTSLFSALPIEERAKIEIPLFDWEIIFSDIFNAEDKDKRGFDIVIGNPPYNEVRDLSKDSQDQLKLSTYYNDAKGGRLNLYQFFYPLSIDKAKEGGIVSMITQNSVLAESSAINNRKLFFKETDIVRVDSFPERDNKSTRVFESAKMSVCICFLQKSSAPNTLQNIPISVWKSRYMKERHTLNICKDTIYKMYPNELIIPISSDQNFSILKKVIDQGNYSLSASAGEVDMTKYKTLFTNNSNGIRVITGAQVLRYRITNNPSQGSVIYLDKSIINTLSANRQNDIAGKRIVMQRITGVDSRIRIISTMINANTMCANSTNYLKILNDIDSKYILGVLNSTLINFFIKQTSTNTNITASVIESIPFIRAQKRIQIVIANIVDYVMTLRSISDVSSLVSNDFVANYFEEIIDGCVYELYFEEHMKEKGLNILETVEQMIKPISQISDTKTKGEAIWEVFNSIKKTDNPIRTRLGLYATNSEILAAIITTK